jgi:hypothetical protein
MNSVNVRRSESSLDVNPAPVGRGKHRVKKGKTRLLERDEARALLGNIPVTKTAGLEGGGKKDSV